MKKKILIILLLLLAFNSFTQTVSINDAKTFAFNYYNSYSKEKQNNILNESFFSETYIVSEGIDTLFYVFNVLENKGFVILTADKRAYPIIGYSLKGNYNLENQPPAFKAWIENRKSELIYIKKNNLPEDNSITQKWNSLNSPQLTNSIIVNPLIQTQWGQGCGFNYYCPTVYSNLNGNCNKTPTGCVATAMGQIMNKWKYPVRGDSSHFYNHPLYGLLNADFNNTFYNWNVINHYLDTLKKSELIYHCGIAVNMDYGESASGASPPDAFIALTQYFKYSNTIDAWIRDSSISDLSWSNMLKNELNNNRPILYFAEDINNTITIKHSFICDGYDSDNNFHFNWGWNGHEDDYYYINNLNPSYGIFNLLNYHFNTGHIAIINIHPVTTIDAIPVTNTASHSVTLNGIVYPNGTPTTVQFLVGQNTNYSDTIYANENINSTFEPQNISANTNNLLPLTTYHYKILATNIYGTIETEDITFTTQADTTTYFINFTSNPGNGGNYAVNLTYHYGDTAFVQATPSYGYIFKYWTENGIQVSTDSVYSFIVNGNRTLVAEFIIDTTSINLSNRLVAYYPFNGNAIDESGKGNNGTVNGATLTTDRFGIANSAYNFDGINNGIYIDSLFVNNSFNELSYSFWFCPNINYSDIQQQNFTLLTGNSIDNNGIGFSDFVGSPILTGNYSAGFQFYNYNNNYNSCVTPINVLSQNQWYHVVVKRDSTNMFIYLNGVLSSTLNFNYFPYQLNSLTIGAHLYQNLQGRWFFNGKIDDVYIYNRTLYQSEIDSLYHTGGWPLQPIQYAVYDIDGNGYDTVHIGTQIWMKQNLKTTHYRNGDTIPNITNNATWSSLTSGAYCDYNNTPSNSITYGRLYNFYTVAFTKDLCPLGWHVPTNAEWTTLINYLGGESIAGDKLKETGLNHWLGSNNAATNESGFSALPGGLRSNNGDFSFIGLWAFIKSSSESTIDYDNNIALYYLNSSIFKMGNFKAFGNSVRCIKGEVLTLNSSIVTNITQTTAISGGDIINDAGLNIIERGICWSTTPHPTLANNFTSNGSGTGSFVCNITGLTPTTIYYLRAYAINSLGIAYGNEISFSTTYIVGNGVTDYDGNVYQSIILGTQEWMKKNLNTTHFRNGIAIPIVTNNQNWMVSQSHYCNYNNIINNSTTYGRLYNFYTVVDACNLCPTNWHIPSDAEWTVLNTYLASYTTGALKEVGTTHWSSNTGATNVTGFTALPSGFRNYDGIFSTIGLQGYWWSNNVLYNGSLFLNGANRWEISSNPNLFKKSEKEPEMGYSVRCIKDNINLNTSLVTAISKTTAVSGGSNIMSYNGAIIVDRGICWSTATNPTIADNHTAEGAGLGNFTSNLSGLNPGFTYYVRAYASNGSGIIYGNEVNFTTTANISPITDYDGNVYDVVLIGKQTWMKQNLKTTHYRNGDTIPNITNNATWSSLTSGAYCNYNNTQNNSNIYGRLYNFYAVNDTRNLCPSGWHVSSKAEWDTLINYLGGNYNVAKLKESGLTHWVYPNTGNNSSGFTALPAGYRFSSGFISLGNIGSWWNTLNTNGYTHQIMNDKNYIIKSASPNKSNGYSVRCIKDITLQTNIIYPKVNLNSISIIAGQNVTISGTDFKPNGIANITLQGPAGFSESINMINTNVQGSFSYTYISNNTMPLGIYNVFVEDSITGLSCSKKSFELIGAIAINNMQIIYPSAGLSFNTNQIINIEWKDKLVLGNTYTQSGSKRNYKYILEYSDNGGSWQSIGVVDGQDYINSNITLNKSFSFGSASNNIVIRIIDFYNPFGNVKLSASFSIIIPSATNIIVNYDWDKSYPSSSTSYTFPQGIAADGTARIFLNLSKINPSIGASIASVTVSLSDGINGTDDSKLGRVKVAIQTTAYNTEANGINSITDIDNTPNKTNYIFWYVAPDDFVGNNILDSIRTDRNVDATFVITYTDMTTETYTTQIKIVRPPLMLVHGLGGDEHTWDDFSNTSLGYSCKYINDPRFIISKAVNIFPDASFITNAYYMTHGTMNLPNTFQGVISSMRKKGYAANRVDYICHSMGGSVIRSIFDNYIESFNRTGSASNYNYKNYEKGYVNKVIMLDVPNHGSPWADIINKYVGDLPWLARYTIQTWYGLSGQDIPIPLVFIKPINSNNILGSYQSTEAVHDLQINQNQGGVKFGTTNTKAHLISGDFFPGNQTTNIAIPQNVINFVKNCGDETLNKFLNYLLKIGANKEENPILRAALLDILKSDIDPVSKALNFLNKMAMAMDAYNTGTFLPESDLIVSVESQLAGIPRPLNLLNTNVSVFDNYVSHAFIRPVTKNIDVGNYVNYLLNSSINSSLFNIIPATPTSSMPLLNISSKSNSQINLSSVNSNQIISKRDTTKLQIISPQNNSTLFVDSILHILINVQDTANLMSLEVNFQNKTYYIDSVFVGNIDLNLQINSNLLGSQIISLEGFYNYSDSGIFVNDIVDINIVTDEQLTGFKVSPDILYLFKNQTKYPNYTGIYQNFITSTGNFSPNILVNVEDTAIVMYDIITKGFKGISDGETNAIVSYLGLSDTIYFVVGGCLSDGVVGVSTNKSTTICAGDIITLTADSSKYYAWSTGETTQSINVTIGGSYSVIVTDTNGCLSTSNKITIIVNTLPDDADSIIGFTEITKSQTGLVYSTSAIKNASSYSWSLPYDMIIDSNFSDSIVIHSGSHAFSGLIKVRGQNDCGFGKESSLLIKIPKLMNTKLYLEGFYNNQNGIMNKVQDDIQDHFTGTTVDTINLEIINPTIPYLTVEKQTLNLNTDGTISDINISGKDTGSYYIAIKHRNHIETWSKNPVSFDTDIINYNFTTAASQAYGDNQIEVSPGVYAIYTGDVNRDGFVDITDLSEMDNDLTIGTTGYNIYDLNGDGYVDITDLSVIDNNLTSGIYKITP